MTTKVRRDASLHESTVKKAATLAGAHAKKPRGKAANKNTRVRVQKVDPRVMKTAKKLAGGDVSRLKIINTTTVVVTNPRVG